MKTPPFPLLALLGALVFGNALLVVYSTARNRSLFAKVSALRMKQQALQVRRGQYQLEEWTLAAHARVARLARQKLKMAPPKRVKIVVETSK